MHTRSKLDGAARERLLETESQSSFFPKLEKRRATLIAAGGMLVMIAVIAVAWAAGSAAHEIFRQYSDWLVEMAAPARSW